MRIVRLALLIALGLGSSVSSVAAQPAPTPSPTPTVLVVPLQAGVQAVGSPTVASIPPTGGQLALGDGTLRVQALPDPTRPPLTLVYQAVDARTLPAAQRGLSLGFGAFELDALTDDTHTPVTSFNVPIDLVMTPSASDMALALDQLSRLHVATWSGSSWVAVPCPPGVAAGTLVCSITQPGLFAPLIVLPTNPALDRLDYDVTGGHFYTQGNGFGGGGGLGYAVVDEITGPLLFARWLAAALIVAAQMGIWGTGKYSRDAALMTQAGEALCTYLETLRPPPSART